MRISIIILFIITLATGVCGQTVSFTSSVSQGCAPLSVIFTNTSTGMPAGTSYEWQMGSSFSNSFHTSYTFSFPYLYPVQLIAYDSDGKVIGKASTNIKVGGPGGWFTPSTYSACPNELISFSYPAMADSLRWDFGDGNFFTDTSSYATHAFAANGEYTVSLTANDFCGEYFYEAIINVSDTAKPAGSLFKGSEVACPGESVFFYFYTTNPSDSLRLDFGDGTSTSVPGPHAYSKEGKYQITFTASNACGNTLVVKDSIVISTDKPFEPVFIDVFPTTVCPGDPVFFYAYSSAGYTSVNWDFGNGQSATGSQATSTYLETGQYDISITVTGCGRDTTFFEKVDIEVSDSLQIDPSDIDYDAFYYQICPGDVNTFYVLGGATHSWDFGDGTPPVTEPSQQLMGFKLFSHQYNTPGDYYAKLTVANGCGDSFTDSILVSVVTSGVSPMASLSWEGFGEIKNTCDTILFYAFGGNYTLDFGDGTSLTSSLPFVSHTYKNPGTYNLTLTVTNGCGETEQAFEQIFISDCFTGTTDPVPSLSSLQVYPNPATSSCTIVRGNVNEQALISLYDPLGREALRGRFDVGQSSAVVTSLNDLSPGLYTVVIRSSTESFSARLVINK